MISVSPASRNAGKKKTTAAATILRTKSQAACHLLRENGSRNGQITGGSPLFFPRLLARFLFFAALSSAPAARVLFCSPKKILHLFFVSGPTVRAHSPPHAWTQAEPYKLPSPRIGQGGFATRLGQAIIHKRGESMSDQKCKVQGHWQNSGEGRCNVQGKNRQINAQCSKRQSCRPPLQGACCRTTLFKRFPAGGIGNQMGRHGCNVKCTSKGTYDDK